MCTVTSGIQGVPSDNASRPLGQGYRQRVTFPDEKRPRAMNGARFGVVRKSTSTEADASGGAATALFHSCEKSIVAGRHGQSGTLYDTPSVPQCWARSKELRNQPGRSRVRATVQHSTTSLPTYVVNRPERVQGKAEISGRKGGLGGGQDQGAHLRTDWDGLGSSGNRKLGCWCWCAGVQRCSGAEQGHQLSGLPSGPGADWSTVTGGRDSAKLARLPVIRPLPSATQLPSLTVLRMDGKSCLVPFRAAVVGRGPLAAAEHASCLSAASIIVCCLRDTSRCGEGTTAYQWVDGASSFGPPTTSPEFSPEDACCSGGEGGKAVRGCRPDRARETSLSRKHSDFSQTPRYE
ncbi:hypothetical protein EV356DRAFT_517431 [Viridothelium virens]|uniref:Uncharacterized protein n=1 Tax=Viridothelium virens TaxID=1048519 RepID=A0A6A6H326_VIRVR|nr:hypothetical protein EV356DRAFT_517431 [Viridothelium virens]